MRKAWILLLAFLVAGCGTPEPPQTAQQYIYIPVVARGYAWQPPHPKRGLGTHHPEFCGDSALLGASWQYNWRPDINDCAGTEDVPMLYCWQDIQAIEDGRLALGGDSDWLMGFNEPDIHEQCNMSPATAAYWWLRIEALARGRKLISPAVVDPGWLASFRTEYREMWGRYPTVDALGVHCYQNSAAGCQALVGEVIDLAHDWGIGQVWVTEFTFVGGADAENEARRFIVWMNDEPMIANYAWFLTRLDGSEYWHPDAGWLNQTLVTWDGKLTRWGQIYSGK